MKKYILDGHNPVPCEDFMVWATMIGNVDARRVAQDKVGDVTVSTVFLGSDYAFNGGPPMLFETMIFGGEHDEFQDRCSTWEQAEAMHASALAMVKV